MRIGLDIMGGDHAPDAIIQGAILAGEELSGDHRIVLIGDRKVAEALLTAKGADPSRFDFVHTTEVIGMGEHPTKAYQKKTDSSLVKGFQLLASGGIDGFASAGNTGAMLVGSMFTIKPIAGVIRPCITSILPKVTGGVGIILDVGTNADCKPDVLYQFGLLGSLFASHVYSINNPKVGLLNIGTEEKKGNMLTQAAYEMMKDTSEYNFTGNIEGRDLFTDVADVIVCDGFTGNVVLKEAEAFYTLIRRRGIDDEYFNRFNYELYGGTPILGVNHTVIKGHGISNATAVKNMILLTRDVTEARLPEKIKEVFK